MTQFDATFDDKYIGRVQPTGSDLHIPVSFSNQIEKCLQTSDEKTAWGFIVNKGRSKQFDIAEDGNSATFTKTKGTNRNWKSVQTMNTILNRFTFVRVPQE